MLPIKHSPTWHNQSFYPITQPWVTLPFFRRDKGHRLAREVCTKQTCALHVHLQLTAHCAAGHFACGRGNTCGFSFLFCSVMQGLKVTRDSITVSMTTRITFYMTLGDSFSTSLKFLHNNQGISVSEPCGSGLHHNNAGVLWMPYLKWTQASKKCRFFANVEDSKMRRSNIFGHINLTANNCSTTSLSRAWFFSFFSFLILVLSLVGFLFVF